jgi:cellulose synthase/poly-beta-1,6-N-acetylglucosamine synthase-like glycosyltransferase
MLVMSILAALLLGGLALLPFAWAWRFIQFYRSNSQHLTEPLNECPLAAVILPLRGADPSLERCLVGLLSQTYRRYVVYIIIDNTEDPARAVVERVLAKGYSQRVKIHIDFLRTPRESCSLKISAQLQAIAQLGNDVEIIVFLDADAIPNPDWLRSLVAPMADPNVGAATGIRWFTPQDNDWGTLVRQLFNAACCTQMYAFNVPWGGSLAFHRRILQRSNLLAHWSQCFVEDASLYGSLRELGQRLEFVVSATIVNRESTDLRGAYRYILRQLTSARLNHINWPLILIGNIGSFIAILTCAAVLAFEITNWQAKFSPVIFFLIYSAVMYLALVILERMVAVNTRSIRPRSFSWKRFAAVPVTLGISMFAMIAATFLKSINWRGIIYDIEGNNCVRFREYVPYRSINDEKNIQSVL